MVEKKLEQQRSLETLLLTKFKSLEDEIWRKNRRYVLAFGIILGILGVFGYREIQQAVRSQLEKQLVKPEIDNMVKTVLKERTEKFVVEKMQPLTENIGSSNIELKHLNTELKNATAELKAMSKQFNILRLFYNSRLGSRPSYEALTDASQEMKDEIGIFALSLLEDLNSYYEEFKHSFGERVIIHKVTGKRYKIPAEEIYFSYLKHEDPLNRQAGANEAGSRGYKYFVEDLVNIVDKDQDLKVQARAVRAIEKLSGEKFAHQPPYAPDILTWWQNTGQTNDAFKSPFSKLEQVDMLLKTGQSQEALDILEDITKGRKGLGKSHYFAARIHLQKGNTEKGKDHLRMVEEECEGINEALFLYVKLFLKEGNKGRAIELLQKVKPFVDNFGEKVLQDPLLKELQDQKDFKKLLKLDS
jgi:hypothetical protein